MSTPPTSTAWCRASTTPPPAPLSTHMPPPPASALSASTPTKASISMAGLENQRVCLHHDAGALGAVVNRAAIRRQLSIMKEMGCNAIRCSHNPPAPELLDLCDQMGFLVMDEAFDMWRKRKSAHDYARYFDQWHERDLDDMIIRDRNHPSIFVWSIGNEVLEQWTHADADTLSLAEANLILNFGHAEEQAIEANEELSVNSLLTIKLADRVSRPRHHAPHHLRLQRARALQPPLPLGRTRHHWLQLPRHMVRHRARALSRHAIQHHRERVGPGHRGYYRMPSDSTFIWPARPEQPFFDPSLSCSSYDNCHVPGFDPRTLAALCARPRFHLRPVRMDRLRLSRRAHALRLAGAQFVLRHSRPRRVSQRRILPLSKRMASRQNCAPHLSALELDRRRRNRRVGLLQQCRRGRTLHQRRVTSISAKTPNASTPCGAHASSRARSQP